MTQEQRIKNLRVPEGTIDAVLDTDAFNEIDDQFAICYLLRNGDKIKTKGICAAPFHNRRSLSPADGMHKSYEEIQKLLRLEEKLSYQGGVYRGSESFLPNETTPVESEAAEFIAKLAKEYSPENPLYLIAIGAVTNVASAILKNPLVKENCVLVWLGGHADHIPQGASEFNMMQDIAAARVVFGCGIPLVQLPCAGVVDRFATSKYELLHWLSGKNPTCDYLCANTIEEAERYAKGKPWTRVIWDVCAVAWLLNQGNRFMKSALIPSPIPEYDKHYAYDRRRHFAAYVYQVNRDALFEDLFQTLSR